MANYIDVDGKKYVQLDDGILAPVMVSLSLEGGTLVNLRADQVTSLRSPILPAEFPLPQAQVDSLRNLTLTGFPSSFSVSNFPSAYSVSNLPTEYPLSTAQATNLSQLQSTVAGFAKGSGNTDSSTLRVRVASDQILNVGIYRATSPVRSSVTLSTSTVTIAATDNARRTLTIYNDSTGIMYVALGAGASTTDFTAKLFQDDSYEIPETNAQLQVTAVWSTGTGAARVTATY
jgi:hypothetical protein